jgi:hypothetical protein
VPGTESTKLPFRPKCFRKKIYYSNYNG